MADQDAMKDLMLDDEFLKFVSGGIYTEEEWAAMTYEERKEAWIISKTNRMNGVYCQLDP